MLKCNTPLWVLRLTSFLLFVGLAGVLNAQCDPPLELPTTDCAQAPVTCLNDACYSTDMMADQGHSGFCGANTLVHNPQYFQVIAVDTTLVISINIDNCTSGAGLQAAIIDIGGMLQGDCDSWTNEDVIACDPNFSGSTTMTATPVDSGSTYLLLIDGSNAATCQYTITQAEGVYSPDLGNELDGVQGDLTACPGDTTWNATVSPPVAGAHGYIWEFTPGGTFTSTNTTLNVGEAGWNGIPVDWDGTYQVCVTPFSGCDTGEVQVCYSFDVIPVDDGVSPPETHCLETYEDVGVGWGQMTISSPGEYTQTFFTPEGCPHDSMKMFESWPVADVGQIDTVVCGEELNYEGNVYSSAGQYDLFYDDDSQYGCDSTAVLNLDLAYITADPSFECDLGDFVINANPSGLIPASENPDYFWYDEMGNVVSTDPMWTTQDPGTYTLVIVLNVNGVQCTYPQGFDWTVDIIPEDIFPDPPVLVQADSVICATELSVYEVEPGIPGDILNYYWLVPGDAIIVGGDGTNEISIDWQNSNGGEVCVSWDNECGESDPVCFDVEVITGATPLFDIMSSPACVDEVVLIEFSGTASDNATFTWDFDGGTIVSGGTGIGPHEISWPTTGAKDVKLVVNEPGCSPDSITLEVMIESLGTPVVNCQSTTSSITFEWSSVSGSSGYIVNVLDGPTGTMVNDTTYEVTGLANGQEVTIEVLADGNGVCPPMADTITCSAEDCVAPMWMITAPDTVCENDLPFDFVLTVNGSAASGNWSGPGITDMANGTFDPSMAGTGPQTVVVQYNNGTCVFNWQRNIVVLAQPTATFTMDASLCELSPATVTYTGSASATATYNWNFGGGTVVTGSGQGPYSIQWASAGTKTVSLTVVENGCTSEPISRMIQLDTALAAPVINCNTTTTSITFNWGNVSGAGTYTVNVLSGSTGMMMGTNSYFVDGLNPGDMVTIEVVANASNGCPPTMDTLTCTAQDCPSPTITISPLDTSMCLYSGLASFDMSAQVAGGSGSGVGYWTGTGITDTVDGTFDPYAAGAGTYVITYTYEDQSCEFTEQTTIYVYDVPSAVISNTDFQLTCDNNNELTLDGSMSTAASGTPDYLWTTSDGNIKTRNDSAYAVAGRAGTYTLTVIDPVSGCRDSVSVTLQQDANVPTADAGPDQMLDCDVDTVFAGGSSSTGQDISYLWSTVNGRIITDPTQPMITVDMPGMYTLVVSDTVNGCESTDNMMVMEDVSAPVIMTSVDGILTCDNQSVSVAADVSGGTNFSYEWTTADGTIQGPSDGASITAISPGFYELVVENLDNGCIEMDVIEVMADSDVIASLEDTYNDVTCFGDADGSVTVTTVVGGSAPYTYAWNTGSDQMALTNLGPGDYTVTVTDNNGCTFQQSWTIFEPELVTADIGDDMTVNKDDSVTISLLTSVDPGAVSTIEWSGPVAPCPDCFDNTFIATESGLVQVMITDTNGCSAIDQIQLNVVIEHYTFAPNVITPNDDGSNDFFNLFGSIKTIEKLSIHDRWGNVVWATNSSDEIMPNTQNQGWDGTFKGEQLDPGVYVFYAKVIHRDDFPEELIGDITLIR